ncbi:MAG: sugar ABC transporter substrate-binding protein [Solirubrobacterales bacterium]
MRAWLALALAALVAAALTACGGGDSSSSSTVSETSGSEAAGSTEAASEPASEASGDSVVAEAKEAVARNFEGTDRPLPKSGPKAQKGKSVFAIPCLAAAPGCQIPVEAFADAGKALGWDVTIADGKGTPAGESAAIDAAIAADADGIALMAISCSEVQPALKRAHDAGIKIFEINGLDCDDPAVEAGPGLFDGETNFGEIGTIADWIEESWSQVANWVIAETNGEAKVIEPVSLNPEISAMEARTFEGAMEKCSGCEVYRLPFTLADLSGNKLEQKVAAALTAHPDANVVVAPYDAALLLGISQAVEAARNSGRELLLTGYEGLPDTIPLIENGVQSMSAGGQPPNWWGWAAADGLNRVFAGAPPVDPGFGLQFITKDKNLPTTPYYNGNQKSQGYEDNYKRIWGVE